MRLYLLPVVLIVCGAGLSALAEWPAPVERQATVAQIDFDALHSQANAALQQLRQLQDRRMAQASAAVF